MWWETTGTGDVDRGDEHVVELADANEEVAGRTFPFSLAAAPAPLSHRGPTFSLEWRIEARLGRSDRASGAASRQTIVVAPDAEDTPAGDIAVAQLLRLAVRSPMAQRGHAAVVSRAHVARLLEDKDGLDRRAEPARIGCLFLFLLPIAGALVILPISMAAGFLGAGALVDRYLVPVSLSVAVLLLAAVLAALARSRRAERDLGLTLRFAEQVVRPGEDLVCTIGLHPIRSIAISSAEVRVTGEESSSTTSPGEAGHTRRVELFRATVGASAARTVQADVHEALEARIPLPRDAAVTFESHHHAVAWRALVTVKPARGMPIERQLTFAVHP